MYLIDIKGRPDISILPSVKGRETLDVTRRYFLIVHLQFLWSIGLSDPVSNSDGNEVLCSRLLPMYDFTQTFIRHCSVKLNPLVLLSSSNTLGSVYNL